MDRLANLRKELSTMSHDEVLDFIRKTRTDRRITKERPAARRTRRVKGEQAKTKALRAVEGMSSDQIAALISQLEGEQENEDSGAAN
jgi:uncharacterized protein YeeX (DUF496 family)